MIVSPDSPPRHDHERSMGEVPGVWCNAQGTDPRGARPHSHTARAAAACLLPQQHLLHLQVNETRQHPLQPLRISFECPWATSQAFPLSLSACVPELFILYHRIVHIFITHVDALPSSSGTSYFLPSYCPKEGAGEGGKEEKGGENLLSLSLPSCQSISSNSFQIITHRLSVQLSYCSASVRICWDQAWNQWVNELQEQRRRGRREREISLKIQFLLDSAGS